MTSNGIAASSLLSRWPWRARSSLTARTTSRWRAGCAPSSEAIHGARAEIASVVAERTLRLEPFGGRAWPAWAGAVAEEAKAFGRALIKQMHGQLLPRASALAGLAAGWWVTHTYTDSRPRSVLHSLGIGSGGTHLVSGDTYRTMRFWLPILAAAILAYLGDRVARWVQQRYQPSDVSHRPT
jgi:hypothetical protein